MKNSSRSIYERSKFVKDDFLQLSLIYFNTYAITNSGLLSIRCIYAVIHNNVHHDQSYLPQGANVKNEDRAFINN